MLSVNDVPAARDIFRRFAIIVIGRSADPFPAAPDLLSL
jgi:hypothetical protein